MRRQLAAAALALAISPSIASAQPKKPAGSKPVTYDVTIVADGAPYTGQMQLAVNGGKVTGTMHIKQPTEITGKAAGSVKAGEMILDFPYEMVQRKCTGQIEIKFKAPAKGAGSKGTVAIAGCGRDASNKLPGTIELTPAK
jgi:hypothetical protein